MPVQIENTSTFFSTGHRRVSRRIVLAATIGLVVIIGLVTLAASFGASSVPVAASTGAGVRVPTTGLYWGGTNKGDTVTVPGCTGQTNFQLLECKVAWAGKQQGITVSEPYASSMTHFYVQCDVPISSAIKDATRVVGRKVVLVNMQCGNWATIASSDPAVIANIKARTQELAALNFPIILTFHHEPENDSCDPQGTYYGTPEDYRAAYRTFSNTVRMTAHTLGSQNIAMGWNLMGFTFNKNGTSLWNGTCTGHTRSDSMIRNPDNWYPGDDATDWLLSDVYDGNGNLAFTEMATGITSWAASCRTVHPALNYSCGAGKLSKPLGFGETAVTGSSEHRQAYFADMLTTIKNFPRLKAYAYWSSLGQDTGYDGRLDLPVDTAHLALKGYAKVELSPYVHNLTFSGSTPTPTVGITPTPVASATPRVTATPVPTNTPVVSPPALKWDINGDGHVNVIDLSYVLGKWGTGDAKADFDGSGTVNVVDLSALLSHWTG